MLTLSISLAAIVLSVIKRLGQARHIFIFLALGAGQIHFACLAIVFFFLSENGSRPLRYLPRWPTIIFSSGILLIIIFTFYSSVSARTISELGQLVTYVIIFYLISTYLKRHDNILPMLKAMTIAAALVAMIGLTLLLVGIYSQPHIFLGRGANEASFFLMMTGVVPAVTLFFATKRSVYILLALMMVAAMIMATSRANVLLSALILVSIFFFRISTRWLRALVLIGIVGAMFGLHFLQGGLLEPLMNYSTDQRIALYEAGWNLWQSRPLVGWGWGSTSLLAPQTVLTDYPHPHFHSTFIQFIVELGALGWFFIIIWVACALLLFFSATFFRMDQVGAVYIALSNMALLASGFVEALLFGADRALQVVFMLALNGAFIRRWKRQRVNLG